MGGLTGKTAIVTGGASGIGKAIAAALAQEGVRVMLASRRVRLLALAAKELSRGAGREVLWTACDVADKSSVRNVVRRTLRRFGSIDFLVNNAGVGVRSKLADLPEREWDRVVDTNLKGTFLMTQAALPAMIKRRSGFILNIASQAAKRAYADNAAYCASKAGVVGLASALQQEVAERGIRVHCLCPGSVQLPPPRGAAGRRPGLLQVEDVAAAALFLFRQPERVKLEDIGLMHLAHSELLWAKLQGKD